MITDDRFDAEIRALTRRIVTTAPLPPDLDLDRLRIKRTSSTARLALASAAAVAMIAAGSVALRAGDDTTVQAGADVVLLQRVELADGTVILRTSRLPDLQLTVQAASRPVFCVGSGTVPDTCVQEATAGVEIAVAGTGPVKALLISTAPATVVLEIDFDGETVRQVPVGGLGLVALPTKGGLASMQVTVTAYDRDGAEIGRQSVTASD
ncbi:MAG: hypothetical protein ACKV2O_00550 [Acidimicrobiales bacterium]